MIRAKAPKIAIIIILILIILGSSLAPFAQSFNFPQRYDMVAILVEQGLYSDPANYEGLADGSRTGGSGAGMLAGISSITLKARIDRYAIDLQNALPGTRALIIQTDRYEQTKNVAAVLEKLYFEGDPAEPLRTAYLRGAVIIGEVPLPVVNKNGTRFISLFPYTDFEQKAYARNEKTQDFEAAGENSSPQPEIWHGVITPPLSTKTLAGKELLAEYFDKNHLYHIGDAAYADFNKRVFFQDFINEYKNLNEESYKLYLNFLSHQSDIAYMRYTKELFKDLAGPVEEEVANMQSEAASLAEQLEEFGIPMESHVPSPDFGDAAGDIAEAQEAGASEDIKDEIPDIMTKIAKMSDNLMLRFNKLFTKYPNEVNDFILGTGRYAATDVDTAVNLITAKDQFALGYLKEINDLVEAKIDRIVEDELQRPIPLMKEARIEFVSAVHKPEDEDDEPYEVNALTEATQSTPAEFTNFSAPLGSGEDAFRPSSILGKPMSEITNVSECSLYRGSKGVRPYSKLVEANHAYNLNSALEVTGSDENQPPDIAAYCDAAARVVDGMSDRNCIGFFIHAGCYYVSPSAEYDVDDPDTSWCFPENATGVIFDIEGTEEREEGPIDFDNFRACSDFHEKNAWQEHTDAVQEYLGNTDDYDYSFERRLEERRPPELRITTKHPDDIIIFTSLQPGDSYTLTLGHVLRGLGWNLSGDSWQQRLNEFFVQYRGRATQIMANLTHPALESATVDIQRESAREISSVFYHKEPTLETLNKQGSNMMTQHLPVDNPRYLTFQDKAGNVRRINYPDIFTAASPDDYLQQLAIIENELNASPRLPGADAPCESCLASLISNLPEIAGTRANRSKISDAINWKNMDIDSKHKYLQEYYLDSRKNAYIGESDSGYELVYYNGSGSAQAYGFSMNKDIPEETDPAALASEDEDYDEPEPYENDPENPFDEAPPTPATTGAGYDLFSWNPPPVSPWWERMQEWQNNLSEDLEAFSPGDSEEEFYSELEQENARLAEEIKKESEAVSADPESADELKFSRIASLELSAESNTVVTGKRADIALKLLDSDGKIVQDEFAEITIMLSGSGEFASGFEDLDAANPGYQILVTEGIQKIPVIISQEPGALTLSAQTKDGSANANLRLIVVENAKIALQSALSAVQANGTNYVDIDVYAWDESSQLIDSASAAINIALSDSQMGRLSAERVNLVNGRGRIRFTSNTKKGRVIINATSNVLDPGELVLTMLPGPPVRIELTAEKDTLPVAPGSELLLTATLFDAHSNAVDTDFATDINFRLTNASSRFASLASLRERVTNGLARTTLRPREETGTVTVVAESAGLTSDTITIKSAKEFGRLEVQNMNTDALAVALLGIPAGNVVEQDYLGGWFINSGKVQAAVSLTAPPKTYKKLFEVSDKGSLNFPEAGRVNATFLPVNNFTMVLRDNMSQTDIAELAIVTIQEGQFEVTEIKNPALLADGIYMRLLEKAGMYSADKARGALRITKAGRETLEIQTNGFLRIFDNDFSVQPVNSEFLTLQVLDKGTAIAEIYFVQRFNQNVGLLAADSEIPSAAGVYIKPFRTPPYITYSRSFSGNSTAHPTGIAFYDESEELSGDAAAGFGFQSLEDSSSSFGVGFTQDNKFGLLFSAGETFGEANRFYASDIGIILGDPSVRVNNRAAGSNFSKDIGKLIYAGSNDVQGLLGLDYNIDGFEDLFVLQADGKIRLIQNNGGYDQLKDQGFILDIKSGIQDFTKTDFNNDGQMDLVVAGHESCRRTDTCLDVYENQGGAFVRRNLAFDQTDKIVTVRAQDLNLDNFPDLVIADSAGDVRVIYNQNGEFEDMAQHIGNVGLQIDPRNNLIQSVLLYYPGVATRNPDSPVSSQNYFTLSVPSGHSYAERDFIYADSDAAFSASTKFAEDLNGGVLRGGDRIRYTITLRNNSRAVKNNVMVSDVIPEQIELDIASIRCTNCIPQQMQIEQLAGDVTRPYVFKNIQVPARGERTIVYEGAFKADTETSTKINISFSTHFTDSNSGLQAALRRDRYPDLSVTKADNPTGQVRYFFTTGVTRDRKLQWNSALSSPAAQMPANEFAEKTGLQISSEDDFDYPVDCEFPRGASVEMDSVRACEEAGGEPGDPKEPPQIAKDILGDLQTKDSDGDGLQDTLDDINGMLDNIANATQAAVAALTCRVGCVSLPLNAAFLSPGFFSMLGVPGAYDIGLPVFGWGAPNIIPTWPPTPALSTLGGRFYVSPALTGGVGFGLCFGSFATPKNCYSFGLNPLDLLAPGLCDTLNSGISSALASANDVISDANEGITLTIPASGAATQTASRRPSGSGFANYSLGSYEAPAIRSRNIRIPGFPSVVTDWWAAQLEEITDKALNLPDIYLIYPSLKSMAGAFQATQNFSRTGDFMTNLLSYLNSVPIIDIETQEVLFKLPLITRKEIEKLKADWQQWIKDERAELDKWMNIMGCFGVRQAVEAAGEEEFTTHGIADPELCRFVEVRMNDLIASVSENMRRLDEWILFPKKILQFRAIEAYYLGQIIDYMDTIIEFTGGWVKRNIAQVKRWRRAIRQIKDTLQNWQALIDVMIDYNDSCDKCKTERYSLQELILKLFMAIPTPPVIPLPKLPDIIIDVSKIQAGMRIKWPDIKFKPVPITIPKIPRIGLGVNLTIPLFKLQVPEIPLIPQPPELPTLPALPALNLPQLPDLPPPPQMPELPGQIRVLIDIFNQIVRILCMIREGFLPTDEVLLKTRIEQITARGLTPILPIDLLFQIQSPTISVTYIDQLIITAFTNLQLDTDFIQRAVEDAAKDANAFSTNLAQGINRYTDALMRQIERTTNPQLNIGPEGIELNYRGSDAGENLIDLTRKVAGIYKSLEQIKPEYEKIALNSPQNFTLEMKTQEFACPEASQRDCFRAPVLRARPAGRARNIQNSIQNSDLILPFQKRLKEYRDNLMAHVKNTEHLLTHSSLADDLNEFSRYIVNQKSAFIDTSLKKFLAAENFEEFAASALAANTSEPIKVGEFDVDFPRMLAYGLTSPPDIPISGASTDSGSGYGMGEIHNIGIFYIDNDGRSQRLTSYTLEADQPSKLADIDLDNDGDKDKIYSYGVNVFAKRNERRRETDERQIFRPVDIEFWTIFELLPHGMSPNYPKVLNEKAHEANFTFAAATMNNIAGFEVIARNSPFFFEQLDRNVTWRTHLLAAADKVGQPLEQKVELIDPDGAVLINDKVLETLFMQLGDNVKTREDSSVTLRASDGTVLHVAEESNFNLTQGAAFELEEGEIEIELPAGSQLFPAGTAISVHSGSVRLRLFDGSDVVIESGAAFTLPDFQPVRTEIARVSGRASFTGAMREFIQSRSGKIHVAAGEILHPLEVVRMKWNADTPGERMLTLSKNILLTVPDSFADGIDIEMERGNLEIIRNSRATQPLSAGIALQFGDTVRVETGSAELHYARGGNTTLRFNETYILNETKNLDEPAATLQIPEGFYFAKIYAFDEDGNRSSGSEKLLLAPQVCGDTTSPLANFGKAEFEVVVGKTLELDAGRSFDAFSNIISYSLDTDTAADSDRDGVADNDSNIVTGSGSTIFTIGPYEEVGQKLMRLTVRDEALNEGYQDIIVNVVTPVIILDAPPLRSNVITGHIEPAEEKAPITIARLRPGPYSTGWEIFNTPSADSGGQYYTDADGVYLVEDLDMRDRLVVRNHEGIVVAEINKVTGRITILDDKYETRVMPHAAGFPVRVGIYLKTDPAPDNPLTFVYYVPDVNTDVTLDKSEIIYNTAAFWAMRGVHVKPLLKAQELGFEFEVLTGDDPRLPGALKISMRGNPSAVIDVNGEIIIEDPGISVREKLLAQPDPQSTEPVIFGLIYNNEVIAEIFIAPGLGQDKKIEIIEASEPVARPEPASRRTQPFSDVSGNLTNTVAKLYRRGIVAGYPASDAESELLFKPENLINRAEFTQIVLKILCIVPRPEAHKLPSPFYDVLNPSLWFYPVLKEGSLRGFIKGYIGEMRTNPETGETQTPFKPDSKITRAEAATIVLAALHEQDIIDLDGVDFTPTQGKAWYEKYIEIAQDLKPYLKNPEDAPARPLLITRQEALQPDKQITREEFAIMAERVLLFHDCYLLGIDENKDSDGDGCNDLQEFEAGTNPQKPDTDEGGVTDCIEINRGTDPIKNPYDDRPQLPAELLNNKEGVFVLRPSCGNICPCRATIGEGADLQAGDIIFSAITGHGGLPIYAKSNEEIY